MAFVEARPVRMSGTPLFTGPPHTSVMVPQPGFANALGDPLGGMQYLHGQYDNLNKSRAETERLAHTLEVLRHQAKSAQTAHTDFRNAMEFKEEEYRRMWMEEETRIKNISEEARRQVEGVRARLIAGLERIDLSNRAMLDAAATLQTLDQDLDMLFGGGSGREVMQASSMPAQPGAHNTAGGVRDWA